VSHVALACPAALVPDLLTALARIPDPRSPRGIRHRLTSILATVVVATLCGAQNFREVADVAADLPEDLLMRLESRQDPVTGTCIPPSEPTIRRAVQAIDADLADRVLAHWLATRFPAEMAEADLWGLALDGKTLCGTAAGTHQAVVLFSAMLHRDATIAAQTRVPAHTTETTQVKALVGHLDLTGAVVTGDAAHTQVATARYLVKDKGAHYVLQVKGNQPTLEQAVCELLGERADPAEAEHVSTERGHGRVNRRAIWTKTATGGGFPYAAQVFRVRRDVFDLDGVAVSKQIAHGITSLSGSLADAQEIAGWVRGQWGIENKIHWVRDAVWREDGSHAYTGSGAQVMAGFRNLAMGLIRRCGITQIKRTLQRLSRNPVQALELVGL
jgi:predicted transposase YbfD/YdcC